LRKSRGYNLVIVYIVTMVSSFSVMAVDMLVKAKPVESWSSGFQNVMSCIVEVPYYFQLSGESDGKLNFILPQGSSFEKGDILVIQDDKYLVLELEKLQNQLEIQKLNAEYNETEYERRFKLKDKDVSWSQLNSLDLARSVSKLEFLKQGVEIEEKRQRVLGLKHIAPSDGSIISVQSQPGDYVTQGTNILTFSSNKMKELNCELPLKEFRRLKTRQNNLALSRFEWHSDLVLDRIGQRLSGESQTLHLYLKGDFDSQMLGERVRIVMHTPNEELSLVPVEALVISDASSYVWLIGDNNKVEKITVNILKNLADNFLVQSKLKTGDRLVSLGQDKLEPGNSVRVIF
jgi:RND family efflux transporter MFP subunit